MSKLTQAQTDLLAAAASHDEGIIDAPQEGGRTAASLIKRGLLIALPQADGPSRLLITTEGRAALGPKDPDKPQQSHPPQAERTAPSGKIGVVVDLLRRSEGATIADLVAATGWQKHSVRGAISGALKKKLGLNVVSEKTDAGRVYRLEERAA